MAEVVFFHHVQGLTPGVAGLADSLREHGHIVHTPDLYEGATFESIDAGIAHSDEIGTRTLTERARSAVETLSAEVVYAGISMGGLYAEIMVLERPGAVGAILLETAVSVESMIEYGIADAGAEWPGEVPFQIHGMEDDPFFAGEGDIDAAREMVATLPDGQLYVYPGNVHLFCDASLPSYDPGATSLALERVEEFLERVDASG